MQNRRTKGFAGTLSMSRIPQLHIPVGSNRLHVVWDRGRKQAIGHLRACRMAHLLELPPIDLESGSGKVREAPDTTRQLPKAGELLVGEVENVPLQLVDV